MYVLSCLILFQFCDICVRQNMIRHARYRLHLACQFFLIRYVSPSRP